ncbi:MAG: hypothetical protein MEQ84_07005 [Mesorhizobium sp.]|nr:hypothetical protein [Mesorhizobium sp.]
MNSWHHLPDLYFLHIPKTAGTSVRMLLEGLYPASRILPVHHLKTMEELPGSAIREARFASGHFGWRLIERAEALGKRFTVLTFLRETAALRVSAMQYVADLPPDVMANLPPERVRQLEQRIAASRSGEFEELVTREVIEPDEEPPLTAEAERGSNIMVRSLAGPGLGSGNPIAVNDYTFQLARERLLSTTFGVVDDMEKSWAAICARLGLPLLSGSLLRANNSKKRLKPSQAFLDLMRRQNGYDHTLERFATEELDRRVARLKTHGGDLGDTLRETFLTTERGVERIREAEITMEDGLVTEGFAPRLDYKPMGRWIRWARKDATLYLPLDASSERVVRFEIASTMNDVIRDGLKLSVNGREIPLARSYERWQDDAFHLICEARIPADAMDSQAQYTALDFHAPEDVKSDHVNAMGNRTSFALANLRID